jgi:hypothetical protein
VKLTRVIRTNKSVFFKTLPTYLCLLTTLILSSLPARAQIMSCGDAVGQLQVYVGQVNAVASTEYYRNIPARCGPNGACLQWWLAQLNAWYLQQSSLVNGWYSTIVAQCSQSGLTSRHPSAIRRKPATNDDGGGLDEDAVKDIKVDDEDKTVRIHIPSTPKGFR